VLTRPSSERDVIRTIGLAVLVNTIGSGMFIPLSALYFTRFVGLSPQQVATGLSIAAVAGIASGVPLGHLADRLGPREVQIALVAGMGILGLCYLWVSTLLSFTIVTTASRVLDRGVAAVAGALIAGSLEGRARIRARARLRTMFYLGLAVGSGLSGVALRLDSRDAMHAVIVLDALTYVLAAALYLRLRHVPPAPRHLVERAWRVLGDRRYLAVTALFSIMNLYVALLTFALPLWIVRHTAAPPSIASVLFATNAMGYVLFQIVVSRRVETIGAAIRAAAAAGVCLCAACVCYASTSELARATTVGVLVSGLVCQLFGGILASSAQFCLAFQLAPDHAQGQYQGLMGTGLAVSAAVAPGVTALLLLGGGSSGWLLLGGIFLVAGALLGPGVRVADRNRHAGRDGRAGPPA
jgi:MFS family permease